MPENARKCQEMPGNAQMSRSCHAGVGLSKEERQWALSKEERQWAGAIDDRRSHSALLASYL